MIRAVDAAVNPRTFMTLLQTERDRGQELPPVLLGIGTAYEDFQTQPLYWS